MDKPSYFSKLGSFSWRSIEPKVITHRPITYNVKESGNPPRDVAHDSRTKVEKWLLGDGFLSFPSIQVKWRTVRENAMRRRIVSQMWSFSTRCCRGVIRSLYSQNLWQNLIRDRNTIWTLKQVQLIKPFFQEIAASTRLRLLRSRANLIPVKQTSKAKNGEFGLCFAGCLVRS